MARESLTIYIDTDCALCSAAARWVARNDPHSALRILSLHSPDAGGLLEKAGRGELQARKSTLVFDERGELSFKSTAVLRIFRHLRKPWPAVAGLLIIPEPVRDALYDLVACNRRLLSKALRFLSF